MHSVEPLEVSVGRTFGTADVDADTLRWRNCKSIRFQSWVLWNRIRFGVDYFTTCLAIDVAPFIVKCSRPLG